LQADESYRYIIKIWIINPFHAVSRSQRRGVQLPKAPERTMEFLTRVRR